MQRHRALKDAAAGEAERRFEIHGREDLTVDHGVLEPRSVTFDDVKTAIGILVAQGVGPRTLRETIRRVLRKHRH